MLYPEQNEARLKLSLDGTWAFALGSCVEDQFDPAKPLPDAQPIAVPASYNDQNDQTTALRRHYGWAWYQRKVTLPTFCAGQRVVLRFGSVTHTAKVWLNGQLIAQHKGGFTPFEADVTALLRPGETVLLTVACDNRVNHSTLPVGNEDGQLAFFGSDNAGIPSVEAAKRAAAPQNRPNFDFFNYAGIHRPVVLYTTPKEYIEDVTVVPAVDGTVQYAVKTTGSAPVHVTVLDADGNAVASAEGTEGTITIPEVHLWEPRPGTPYLYTLHATCGADVYDQTFGVQHAGPVVAEHGLAGGAHGQTLFQLVGTAHRDPRHLRREAIDQFALFLQQAFWDQHGHGHVLMAGGLEPGVQILLDQFPDGLTVGTQDDETLHAGVLHQLCLDADVGVPLCEVFFLAGDRLYELL